MATNSLDSRREQMFPRLDPAEVQRLRRFGQIRRYGKGEALYHAGDEGLGMFVLLDGEVRITRKDAHGHEQLVVDHGPRQFLGEIAALSGRAALVDGRALSDVEAIVIPPEQLRAALVAEAELGERIMRALILRRVGLIEAGAGPVLVGPADDADVLRLQNFLTRNAHPHQYLDPGVDQDAHALIDRFHVTADELPLVLCPDGSMLRNPSEEALARCIGLAGRIDPAKLYDVAIVGAGPAGMAAAVYAASEGLAVLMLDARAFGGQAGASARIENYLGFPAGISGMALMGRANAQAQKFGADMAIPDGVVHLQADPEAADGARFRLSIEGGETARARSLVVASGARYRRLDVPGMDRFECAGAHYWASPLELQLCDGQEIVLVGAGNSAGQAVVYLASKVAKVWLIARGASLRATMSRYLVDRIEGLPNVEVLTGTEVVGLEGEGETLQRVRWRRRDDGAETTRDIRHLFLFIGAEPNTGWLSECDVAVDDKGFVVTGGEGRHPLETSLAGAFAIGDVRAGSVKRVAAAVGEGAQVVAAIHAYLARQEAMDAGSPDA